MVKPTKEEAVRAIVDIIRNAPSGTATGPHLGSVLKYKLEAFHPSDFHVPTLKSFIQNFVPDVEVTVNSRTDVIYTLKRSTLVADTNGDANSEQPPPAASSDTTKGVALASSGESGGASTWLPSGFWFALVSPTSKKRVSIEQQTGQMKLEDYVAPLAEGWVRIDPLTPEDHCSIAREYSGRLPSAHRAKIDSLIGSGELWWKGHFSALYELGLGSAYRRFHSDRAIQMLDRLVREKAGRSLKSLHLPDGRMVAEYVPQARSVRPLQAGTPHTPQVVREPAKDDQLRSLAERLVRNMSRAEMRQIKVSLGDVVDLL